MNILDSFVKGFSKRAGAPESASGPVPQPKQPPSQVEPAGTSDRIMDEASRKAAIKVLRGVSIAFLRRHDPDALVKSQRFGKI